MINLADLAARLDAAGVINKSFMECTKDEIIKVVEAVISCPDSGEVPADGWTKPYFHNFGDGPRLVVGFSSHPKYHWWKPIGDSLSTILVDLEAPYEVAREYLQGLTEEQWAARLVPFK